MKIKYFVFKLLAVFAIVCFSVPAFAQNIVTGTVTGTDGLPLIGAAVLVSSGGNSGTGTSTGPDGQFSIKVQQGQQLTVSYITFKTATVAIVASKTVYNIVLEPDNEMLEETVVVGYGSQKKVNLSGAVSSIDSKSFARRPIVSTSAAIQGLAPGVTVTTQSGEPGADGGSIRIRGIGSFGGSSTSPLVLIDGIEGNINNVDPDQIESISVLKDAASSSIYGSRAANGVILVTTKRGSDQKFSLNYKGYFGWQAPTDLPDLVNAVEYRELVNAMNTLDGIAPTYNEQSMTDYKKNVGTDPDKYPDTDWQKAVLNGSGFTHRHTLSLGISSDRVRMLTTLGYADQEGLIKSTNFQRYSFRNNADIKFNDKLSMKLDVDFSNSNRNYSPYHSTVFNYMNTRPSDIVNQFSTGYYNGLGMQGNNPVALTLEGGTNNTLSNHFNGSLTLIYKPAEWITLSGMMSPRYDTANYHNWRKAVTTYQDVEGTATLTSAPFTTLTESGSRSFYQNYNFIATLAHKFGVNDIKAILGAERNTFDYHNLSAYRQGFEYDYDQIAAGNIDNMDNDGYLYQWAIQSFFGRLNYSFKDKYLFEANLRVDGSSRFIPSKRWGYFPSASAAWRVTEEPFMKPFKDVINSMKLRASYGTLGNQNLAGSGAASYYPTTQNLSMGNISMNDNIYSIITQTTLANPEISWETTTMADFGVDLTLFRDFSVTADWYQKNTKGILMTLDIPLGVGMGAPYQNAGSVKNTGWEIGASYNHQWGDFTLGVNGNLSDVNNKITNMDDKTSTNGVLRNQEGYSIASIYALKSLGIIRTQEEADEVNNNCPQFNQTVRIGDIRYEDMTGDKKITTDDYTIVGSTIPRYTYSLNLDLGWKGVKLGMLFQGVGKVDGYLDTYYVMPSNMGGTFRKEHMDYTWENNPNGSTPRLSATNTNNWQASSFWMKSASYLRLKNIQIGYDLPSKWVKSIGLGSIYVYANGQNMLTFTNFWQGYDPEVNYGGTSSNFDAVAVGSADNYPQVKIVTFGMTINF